MRFTLSLALLNLAVLAPASRALTLPDRTTVPILFTHTIDSAKARSGDAVTAKTMQVVFLADGKQIPKGTLLQGHVVEARPFKFDDTPYAVEPPSYLSVQIDSVMLDGVAAPVSTEVRALASAYAVQAALSPQRLDETDMLGTIVLIGGAHYSPIDKRITEGVDSDVVGYNKRQGVFACPMPASYTHGGGSFRCDGSRAEQSMAVFSPDACGLYGFVTEYLAANGANGPFRLESTHHTVVIRAGSAALLQVEQGR